MSGRISKNNLSKDDREYKELENQRRKEMAKYVGNNIHQYRINAKLTREQLAEKSNLTASHIYQLEIGNSIPSIITIIDICNALDISIAQITDNLIFNEANKFTEVISKDFNKLTDKQKNAIIQLIKNLTDDE